MPGSQTLCLSCSGSQAHVARTAVAYPQFSDALAWHNRCGCWVISLEPQSKLYNHSTALTSQCPVRLEVRIRYLEVATMFYWPKTICMTQLCLPEESK